MLNASLIEQFQIIHQEQRGGALEVTLGERKIRFGFEQGELSMLDLGEEKELAMARKLLDYHKIGPEIHRHAVAMARATGGSIVDTLRRQQLVSDSEIDQVSQAMIEDLFSLLFGLASVDMTYRAEESLETFDLEKRAVRLKSDIPSLLESVQARVAEEEAVLAELGGWDSVMALDEGGDADQLDDFERHVLTQIDGRKTVEQIAIAFRDSNFSLGRTLTGMMRKGFIKRGALSSVRGASTTVTSPVATEPDAPNQVEAPVRRTSEFEIYRPAEPPPSNNGFRLVLGTVFAVLLAIGVFVWLAGRQRGAVDDRLAQISQQIEQSAWIQARESLDRARLETGNDLGTVRQVEQLEKRLAAALAAEAERIDLLIESQQFAAAGEKLDRLPADHPRTNELRQRRTQRLSEFERRSETLLRQVEERLERRDVAGAFALLATVTPTEAEAPLKAIDRWRLATIDQARRTSLSLGERQALVNLLQSARPSPYQQGQVQLLQEELNRGQNRRQEQVLALTKRVERGAWLAAQTEVDKERLLDQAPGSALLADVTRLTAQIAAVRKELEAVPQVCSEALAAASDPQAVTRARQRVIAAIARYPEASNLAELQGLDQMLSQLESVVGRGTTEDEATALGGLLTDQPPDSPLVRAAKTRIAALRAAALDAQGALESARALGREGQWDESIAALTRISARPEWKRTPTGVIIGEEILQAEASKQRLEDLSKKFRARLNAGDIAGAFDLSRQMGLRYLPLLVESMPPGATVLRDGAELGSTPLVVEIPAGDRLELQLELRAPGCLPLTLSGADAVGGWRLSGALRRQPLATAQLRVTLSSQPAGADGRVWVAGSAGVAAVDATGTVSTFPYADEAGSGVPVEPVYAPATLLEDGVYIATRDRFALRIAGQQATRVPLPTASDGALLSYRSTVILDRRFLICAGVDGTLAASDPDTPGAGWISPTGAPFAGPLCLLDEVVLAVRRDGEVLALQVDRGDPLGHEYLGEPVVSAWKTSTGLAGITATKAWTWNGVELHMELLPRSNAVAGAPGLLITKERQVLVLDGSDWKQIGYTPGDLTAAPIMWRGHPVLVSGKAVYVLGAGGFQVDASAPFLAPAVVGDNLALVTSDGEISFFAP